MHFFIPDIEDLTHKTGNFKQFSIFNSMLESAITQVGGYFHTNGTNDIL